jgi:putative heme-binding domain-containing protein
MRAAALIVCMWGALVLAGAAQTAGRAPRPIPANLPETNPYASPTDLAIGRALYVGRCGHCHGQDGEGGRGAVLTGRLRRGGSDRELFVLIRNGIPDTEMTGTFSLADTDIWRVVGHVRELGRQGTSEPSAGDPAAGALVYQKAGCAACHTIDGQGGLIGPDLSDIGARRSVRHLRASLLDPNADIPLDYRPVTVTTATGASIAGIHLNEDEYSIHLRDGNGDLRSFMKRELKGLTLPRQSLMPSYASLLPADVENLVAFLGSLQAQRRAQ